MSAPFHFRIDLHPTVFVTGCAVILSCFSLVILSSIAPSLVWRQALFLVIGLCGWWATQVLPFFRWIRLNRILYAGLLVLLLSTQVFGVVTRGSRSWIPIGEFHIQPSQLAAAITGLTVVTLLTAPKKKIDWRRFVLIGTVGLLPVGLILLEPDFGSAMMVLVCVATLIFLGPTPWRFLLAAAGVAILTVVIAWLLLFKPYQKDRILSFFALTTQTDQGSYNAIQSVIAVGAGGWFGQGIGQGTQAQYRFLPERQTDFIFASLAEEFGLVGSASVVALYICMVGGCLWLGATARDPQYQLFSWMTAGYLAIQATINIGMNMGIMPITGITLPFLSYGGSSLIGFFLHLGILASVRQEPRFRDILRTV